MVRLETILNSWKTVREDTALAVEEFPGTEADFKPMPELDSFRTIARHILDSSNGLTGVLLEGTDNLATPQFRELLKPFFSQLPQDAGLPALAAELRSALDLQVVQLAAQPAGFYSTEITRFDGQRVTRLEMLQFIKEHELKHRAQLFMYLRLKGIVPATTRRRLAKAKAQ